MSSMVDWQEKVREVVVAYLRYFSIMFPEEIK
jgi:hypothetical protein